MTDTEASNENLDKILKSFEICDSKINDVCLIVEGRILYASSKFLSNYSHEFFKLLNYDAPPFDENPREIVISDPYYDNFCSFLALLHNHTNVITKENFLALSEISFKYKADQCLEECEKYVMKQNIGACWSLKYAGKFNWGKLKEQVLHSFCTVDDLLNFCNTKNIAHLSHQTQSEILGRLVELKDNKPIENIVISQTGVTNQTIGGIPWTITFNQNDHCFQVTVSCNIFDNFNPWKCRFSIECVKEDTNEIIKQESHVLCWNQKSIVFKCCADTEICTLFPCSDLQVYLKIHSITGIFAQRSTLFSEERLDRADVTLSVGNKKFNVSKQILAYHSSYFYSEFYSDPSKYDVKRVTLTGVGKDEFENCLQAVYHPSRLVTDTNINDLLKVSHKYGFRLVLQKCENFFQMDDSMNDAQKLKLTETYDFPSLYKQIASKIKTFDDLDKFFLLDGFDELHPKTIKEIVMRIKEMKKKNLLNVKIKVK